MNEEEQEINNGKNIDFAYNVMTRKLDAQSHAFTTLEAKTGILFGFVGVVIGSIIILINNLRGYLGNNLFTVGLVLLFITLLLLALASKTRAALDPPDFDAFYSESALAKENVEMKNQIIADMKDSYTKNAGIQITKARYYNHALWLFALSALLLTLGIVGK